MRTFLFIAAFVASDACFAQIRCVDKLLPLPRPSAAHQLSKAEWATAQEQSLGPAEAMKGLHALVFGKFLCRQHEVELGIPTCLPMDPTVPEVSTVCYVPSNLGYFSLTLDSAINLNLVFHKIKQGHPAFGF